MEHLGVGRGFFTYILSRTKTARRTESAGIPRKRSKFRLKSYEFGYKSFSIPEPLARLNIHADMLVILSCRAASHSQLQQVAPVEAERPVHAPLSPTPSRPRLGGDLRGDRRQPVPGHPLRLERLEG